jgi:hypothetical protein
MAFIELLSLYERGQISDHTRKSFTHLQQCGSPSQFSICGEIAERSSSLRFHLLSEHLRRSFCEALDTGEKRVATATRRAGRDGACSFFWRDPVASAHSERKAWT